MAAITIIIINSTFTVCYLPFIVSNFSVLQDKLYYAQVSILNLKTKNIVLIFGRIRRKAGLSLRLHRMVKAVLVILKSHVCSLLLWFTDIDLTFSKHLVCTTSSVRS